MKKQKKYSHTIQNSSSNSWENTPFARELPARKIIHYLIVHIRRNDPTPAAASGLKRKSGIICHETKSLLAKGAGNGVGDTISDSGEYWTG